MATALDQTQDLPPQPAIGKGKVGDTDPPGKVGVEIKAAIFFDGTGNNQSNIKKRLANPSYMRPLVDPLGFRESYKNGFSNVALLHFMHQKEEEGKHIISVYIEGIGTVNDGDDPVNGRAFGSGPSGIVDRVTEGIIRLASKVSTLLATQEDSYLKELSIHAFGFSRGAAAARHFCARRTDPQGRRNSLTQELGAAVDQAVVKLKFVGLFDTVSSFDQNRWIPDDNAFGIGVKMAQHLRSDSEFRNDVQELSLRLEDPTLEKVVQLRAVDEFRVNFSITNIESATSQHKGLELLLPGAHSDVGGSYHPDAQEVRLYKTPAQFRLADYFQQKGYYAQGQLVPSGRGTARLLTGTRTPGNAYQFVSLAVMLELTVAAACEVTFDSPTASDERTAEHRVPEGRLSTLRDQLAGFAKEQFAARPAEAVPAPVGDDDYHWLRRNYLHLSWSGDKGMEMRTDTRAYDAALAAYQDRLAAQAASTPAPADSTGGTAVAAPPPVTTPVEAPPIDDSYLPYRLPIPG